MDVASRGDAARSQRSWRRFASACHFSQARVLKCSAALASGAGTRSRSTLRPRRGSIALAVRALKTRDGSRQKNDPFKEFEERRFLCAFASMRECLVALLWVRRSETNRPSECLEDTRGELARKGLTHRRMSNDSPKIKWSCQRINEQVGVGDRKSVV